MVNVNDNKETSVTQCNMIAAWLKEGRTLTSLDALRLFGCMRLASRICDLRDRGMDIKTIKVKVAPRKWVTEYSLNNK